MTLSTSQVESILKAEKDEALGVNSSTLSEERRRALDYYMGDMAADMPSQEGRSAAVSSDVADTVEGLMPNLMEIFGGSEEVVKFEPVGPEDEEAAAQETDYVNHVFMQKNPGWQILYSFIKDALLSKVGIVKVYWDKYEREERETYENQSDEAYVGLLMRQDMEVAEHKEREDDEGQRVHDVVLVSKRSYACARVVPVPPEEFGIKKTARCLKDATYCYHEPAGKTESDLIAEGYDKEQVESLPGEEWKSNESSSRDQSQGANVPGELSAADKSMRLVRVTEHYKVFDYEGKGKPALYRITTGGERFEVLKRDGKPDIQPIDMLPFAACTPIIMTHRFFGRAVADVVIDIQKIKTSLLRALLDNAYLCNNQRNVVVEELAHPRTIDDILTNRPGGVIRTKKPGAIEPMASQPIGNFAYPLVEYIDSVREWRTGVTRQGQGIDANSLQNQSATAVNQIFTAAQARVKLIARVLAETGIRDLFSLLHATIRKNDTQANVVRLRNKWVQVDPRVWRTRDDMTINVGLGTGSREQQIQHVLMILGLQKEAIQVPQLGLVDGSHIYNSVSKLVDLMHLKSPESYFNDPEQNPPQQQQPPPDPKLIEVQGKLQLEQQRHQGNMQVEAAKVEIGARGDQAKIAAETQLKREQFAAEIQLRREQMIAEVELKREEMLLTARMKAEHGYYKPNGGGVAQTHLGGEPG